MTDVVVQDKPAEVPVSTNQPAQAPTPPPRKMFDVDLFYDIDDTVVKLITKVIRGNTDDNDYLVNLLSVGGNTADGLVLFEKLEASHHKKAVIVLSRCYSFATAYMCFSNTIRLAYPSTRFLIHRANVELAGDFEEVTNSINLVTGEWGKYKDLIKSSFGISDKEAKKLFEYPYDKYTSAEDMLNLGDAGGIDGIILKDLGDFKYLCKTRGGNRIIDIHEHTAQDVPNLPIEV